MPELSVQYATKDPNAPSRDLIERCVACALPDIAGELTIRIVDEPESAALNKRYRGRPGATNVLAFPAGESPAPDAAVRPLGDIAICAPIVAREAAQQRKPLEAHWAHIVIHGCLHLCGYDHQTDAEAEPMEERERTLLARLGFADPYPDEP